MKYNFEDTTYEFGIKLFVLTIVLENKNNLV